jgi:hypothetical protein
MNEENLMEDINQNKLLQLLFVNQIQLETEEHARKLCQHMAAFFFL